MSIFNKIKNPTSSESANYLIAKYKSSEDADFLNFWTKSFPAEESFKYIKNEQLKQILEEADKAEIIHLLVVTENGDKTETIITGKGKPVMLVCGYGHTAPQWRHQFEALNDKYMMICINFPDIGLSESTAKINYERMAETIRMVLNQIGVNNDLSIVASSWGGIMGQVFAYKYQEMIRCLILVNSFNFIKIEIHKGMPTLKKQLDKEFIRLGLEDEYRILNNCESIKGKHKKDYMMLMLNGFNVIEYSKKLNVPTLVVDSEKDSCLPEGTSRWMYESIPNADYCRFMDAGHLPNITHYKRFNEMMISYIENNYVDEQI